MTLKKIFENLDVEVNNDLEITKITTNSREVIKGSLFIAINGFTVDGHNFIDNAIDSGAVAILIGKDRYKEFKDKNVEVLTTDNTRKICALVSCNFFGNPTREFKLIGVTGTKGKTTTTFMIKEILEEAGNKVGLVGTVANYSGKRKIEDSERTTPDPIRLQELFREMADDGCNYVIMEVSSQSLKLGRVDGCEFNVGLFTNFSEDHISPNEHPTMEDYFLSKTKLFDMVNVGFANIDDPKSKRLIELKKNCNFKTYSVKDDSDKKAENIEITNISTKFDCNINNEKVTVEAEIPGEFTVYNALGAISVTEYLGISSKDIVTALKRVRVPGRSELVNNKLDLPIMIDYAHSDESLRNILKAVKGYTKGRVICVFGCGGDRDARKRPKMAKVSGEIADYTIITSDNPRTEDPVKIIEDVVKGIEGITENYEVIVDRKDAIKRAIEICKKEDLVVLAGKGHEDYQIIGTEKYPFDERIIIKEIIDKM